MLVTMIMLEWDYTDSKVWDRLEKLCRLGFLTGEDVLNVAPAEHIRDHAPEFFQPIKDAVKGDEG